MTSSKTPALDVEKILFGNSNRQAPDEIDEMVIDEIIKAGREGITTAQVVERLMGRELTKDEWELVELAERLTNGIGKLSAEELDEIALDIEEKLGRRVVL